MDQIGPLALYLMFIYFKNIADKVYMWVLILLVVKAYQEPRYGCDFRIARGRQQEWQISRLILLVRTAG